MLQFSKVLASLCAGCLCTLTIHQIPALGNVLLPQTHAIPETSPIRPVDVMPLEPLPTPAETAPAMSIPPTETQSPQTQTTAAVATAVTVLTATATTTIPPETTAATESETTVAVTSTIPESDPFFQEHETWFKAYMDYCTITDTDSVQYAMEQNAWTDDRGLRRMADDYLVAMGTGWLESGCGERFAVTLENGSEFTVRVGDKFAAVFHDDLNILGAAAQLAAAKVKGNDLHPVRAQCVRVQDFKDGAETDERMGGRSIAVAPVAGRIGPANRTIPRFVT